ncbi:MAG: hypothetical protein KatS3mg012_0269 [Gaiellaceae bacterium]|nr:MAG: hypothetical protein KatS3mg012_0269 [Gaiellaceae bacterium]
MADANDGYVPLNPRRLSGHQQILALVPPRARVLDVGCSAGTLARPLVEKGCSVIGIERDPVAAARAREVCDDVMVADIETAHLPFARRSFDAIVCADVIEHLRDPVAVLRRLHPLLRPGGTLALSTPNVANWSIRLSLLAGRWRYTERGILDRTHVHLFTRATLSRALANAGYRITSFGFTAPVPVLRCDAVERVAHVIGRVRPSLFAYQFVVGAEPV